jgi:hypothetical protein
MNDTNKEETPEWISYITKYLNQPPPSYYKVTFIVGDVNTICPDWFVENILQVYKKEEIWSFRGVPVRSMIKLMKNQSKPIMIFLDCLTKFKKQRNKIRYTILQHMESGVNDNLGPDCKGMMEFHNRPHVIVFTHKPPDFNKFDENHSHVVYTYGKVQFGKNKGIIKSDGVVQWEQNKDTGNSEEEQFELAIPTINI